jgi:hypothetical protein
MRRWCTTPDKVIWWPQNILVAKLKTTLTLSLNVRDPEREN